MHALSGIIKGVAGRPTFSKVGGTATYVCKRKVPTEQDVLNYEDLGCVEFGFAFHSDLNASRNIVTFSRRVGGRPSVSGPNVASVDAKDQKVIEEELGHKPTNSFVGS